MRYFLGIDSGSISTDAVLLDGDARICASVVVPTGNDPKKAIRDVREEVCAVAAVAATDIVGCIACGYGRHMVAFADRAITEITAHARGARYFFPDAQVVVDIGGEDTKVIAVGSDGHVDDFLMNNKCAAGTGRFLEALSARLECSLDYFIDQAQKSRSDIDITSTCTVFAESEVVSLLAEGMTVPDIARAVHRAIVNRVVGMARPLIREDEIVLTGGVARNAMISALMETEFSLRVLIPENPQIVGAVGSALLAREYTR